MIRVIVVTVLALTWSVLHTTVIGEPMPFLMYIAGIIALYGLVERFEVEDLTKEVEEDE